MGSEHPEDFATMKDEVEELRRRVARLENENERLTMALRGRTNSTLPLRSVNPSAVALYANRLRESQK
jgi:hypothetical protein